MTRSGVFIGVDQTGGLQKLKDASKGAKRMHQWALNQGMVDGTAAQLITDETGQKVTPDQIFQAIAKLVRGAGVEQLVLYFAGHGVNINRSEYWLLTDAPEDPNAAVNVSGSVELARYCGAGEVFVISDACRVAADGIQAQNVRGYDVFPNNAASDHARPVSLFFACGLGRVAAEIRDPGVAAANYTALYTGVLLQALEGRVPEVWDTGRAPGDTAHYLQPLALQAYLERAVPELVRSLHLEQKVNQAPDAIPDARSTWISRLDVMPRPILGRSLEVRGPAAGNGGGPGPGSAAGTPGSSAEVRLVADLMVQNALSDAAAVAPFSAYLDPASRSFAMVEMLQQLAPNFGPEDVATGCGIKVRGAAITSCLLADGSAELLSPALVSISVNFSQSVLVRFSNGLGAMIPVIPGYLASLTFEAKELVDVAFEPSRSDYRWREFAAQADRIRKLRSVAAAATHFSRFRLDGPEALEIATKMQFAKGLDPTLAVYAAYAFHDLQELGRIRTMASLQRQDMQAAFFDLALLGRELLGKTINRETNVLPCAPLLAQGWALLSANGVKLPASLNDLQSTLVDSLWSLFTEPGLKLLERALMSKEIL